MEESTKSIFVLYPPESSEDKGLLAKVYLDRFANYFNYKDKEELTKLFPRLEKREYHEWAAGEIGDVYFKSEHEIDNLLTELNNV
ncbi:hypothetical protein [Natranaerofaba carboxydovora]|uniref:hypothetical protein n=1 Tax=Natranaerofaba carboxydovora TaxID=2742683 RepID=UPI001F12F48D|nr:hypothetical protein [Natranaerofaba carboxydovora]UMZ73567.1 hypothetical protein ACONDI_01122 [Natranaerofaba carboxydovora]